MTDPPPNDRTDWGACRFCGVATEPGAKICGICGAENPLTATEMRSLKGKTRRRIQLTGLLRSIIVIGVALGLGISLIALVLQGPPQVDDPLTTAGMYSIGPGNFTVIQGEITGGDFVIGNFSTASPVGTDLVMYVFNSTETNYYLNGLPAQSVYTVNATDNGRIIYSAPYTDTFAFVFVNPYPATSGLTVNAYIVTNYESNVGDDGFG